MNRLRHGTPGRVALGTQIPQHAYYLTTAAALTGSTSLFGVAGDLVVHLKRYSKDLVENTFMRIKQPEIPLDIPTRATRDALAAVAPVTIGQFYAGVRALLAAHPEIFTGDPALQVTGFFFGPGADIPVTDLPSALLAIETIVEQGEGTPKSPTDLQKQIAHYYRFQQFSKGMQIVDDPASPLKVSSPLTIDDTADVIQMVDDPPLVTYDEADSRRTVVHRGRCRLHPNPHRAASGVQRQARQGRRCGGRDVRVQDHRRRIAAATIDRGSECRTIRRAKV